MGEYLPLATLLRLLVVLALVLAPHAANIPAWESAFIAALLAWRGVTAMRQWRMPPAWARATLTIVAFVGVVASYQKITGQLPGTALLCVMVALKVLELRARRDVMVVMFMMYFILLTEFFGSQDLWTVAYLLACTVLITAVLVDCNHAGDPLRARVLVRRGAAMVAQSLPLMVALFILFPRIPGPLWGLPADAGGAKAGLSDHMSPGDIAGLISSNEVAFRVVFDGPAPPNRDLYWRGPVLDQFDGRTWNRRFDPTVRYLPPPDVQLQGRMFEYEVTLEPHNLNILLGIESVARGMLPPGSYISAAGELLAEKPVRDRLIYRLRSSPRYVLAPTLDPQQRVLNLRLPRDYDRRTQALGRQWRREGLGPRELARRALDMFRKENFVYTLTPPKLGRDTVDGFLFGTRRGFCEHYASAFTVLMRSAGVPARVVSGYQGGKPNDLGGYYVVSQADAHAWSEIWEDGYGWERLDPTAAVSPDRVEKGIEEALGTGEGLPGFFNRSALRAYFEVRWDLVNARWNALVLAYGPKLQQEFLSRFGIKDMGSMILALTIVSMVMLSIVGAVLLRQFAPARTADTALLQWQRATRKLLHAGIAQRPDEGPRDFASRVAAERPELSASMERVLEAYLGLRYLREPDAATLHRLTAAVKELKP